MASVATGAFMAVFVAQFEAWLDPDDAEAAAVAAQVHAEVAREMGHPQVAANVLADAVSVALSFLLEACDDFRRPRDLVRMLAVRMAVDE